MFDKQKKEHRNTRLSDFYDGAESPSFNQIAECFDVLSLLYHSQTQIHVPYCYNMKPQKKVTNKRASRYDISIAFPSSAITIGKTQQK
jgi:hypothetical protein